MKSTKRCRCAQCERDVEADNAATLSALARGVAGQIHADLANLYAESLLVAGELRYHLLWRLSELERIQLAVSRCIDQVTEGSSEDLGRIEAHIAELSKRGAEFTAEARLLVEAWRQSAPSHATRRIPSASGCFSRRSSALA